MQAWAINGVTRDSCPCKTLVPTTDFRYFVTSARSLIFSILTEVMSFNNSVAFFKAFS